MKMTRRIALGTAALALCGALFFSCSNSAGGNLLAGAGNNTNGTGSQPTQGGGSGQTQSPAAIAYNKLWEGSKTMAWSGDENCVVIDHAVSYVFCQEVLRFFYSPALLFTLLLLLPPVLKYGFLDL